MDINPYFFYIFAGLAIAFSLSVVLKKSPVASAFSLVMVFFCFAGIYAILDAHLIAALQVLVYAGAIMVLFVFVIMLLNADTPSLDMQRTPGVIKLGAGTLSVALLGIFIYVLRNTPETVPTGSFTLEKIRESGGNTLVLSQLMFSQYILPFELTSVLLLGGIVGAVAIAKRKA